MDTKTTTGTCNCGGHLVTLDSAGHSTTKTCQSCFRSQLVIEHPRCRRTISLRVFRHRRGNREHQRSLTDHSMAEGLVRSLQLDEWPSNATVIEFGIASPAHLRALQHAVRAGVTAYDLDRVMGDGIAITRLVQGVPGQPCPEVTFETFHDRCGYLADREMDCLDWRDRYDRE